MKKKKATDSKKHTQNLYTSWQRNSSITKEKKCNLEEKIEKREINKKFEIRLSIVSAII